MRTPFFSFSWGVLENFRGVPIPLRPLENLPLSVIGELCGSGDFHISFNKDKITNIENNSYCTNLRER